MPNLPCTQEELYTVSRLGWLSCQENIGAFTAYNSLYTAQLVIDQMDLVDDAEALPNLDSRTEISRINRVNLANIATTGRGQWQNLKNYITDAFPKDELEIRLSSAGAGHYQKAADGNWNATSALFDNASTFMINNLSALQAAGMPASFPVAFGDVKKDFNTAHTTFLTSEQKNRDDAHAKEEATFNAYTSLSKMFAIGQRIYANDPVMLQRFVFADVLALAGNATSTGYKGMITDSATTLPIQGVSVTCVVNNYAATTDEDGRYHITPMEAGTYTFTFQANGYTTVTKTITITTGSTRIQNFALTAI